MHKKSTITFVQAEWVQIVVHIFNVFLCVFGKFPFCKSDNMIYPVFASQFVKMLRVANNASNY